MSLEDGPYRPPRQKLPPFQDAPSSGYSSQQESSPPLFTGLISGALLSAIVSIQVEPAPSQSVAQTLGVSCSVVFGDRASESCRVGEASPNADYRVKVTWSDEAGGLKAHIELSHAPSGYQDFRDLSFDGNSGEGERWEAIGLVIAALVNAHISSAPPPAPPPEKEPALPPAPPLKTPQPEPVEDHSPELLWELGGIFQGNGAALVSVGGATRFTLDLGSPVRPTVAFAASGGASPLSHMELRPALGLELSLLTHPIGLALTTEALLSVNRWWATQDGVTETAWRSRYGAKVGGALMIPFNDRVGLSLRGAGTFLAPPVDLLVEDQVVGKVDPWGAVGALGLSVRF